MPDDEIRSRKKKAKRRASLDDAPRGTFNFWIDRNNDADAFAPGVWRRWGEFPFGGEMCVICSNGPTLAATLRMGSDNPRKLFRIPFEVSLNRRRLVTIGWSKGRMKVLLDSRLIADMPLVD